MVVKLKAKGIDDCSRVLDGVLAPLPNVFMLFVGNNDAATGKSWCPDCVEAEPIIEKAIEESAPKEAVIISTEVGDRTAWKDPNNPFRRDSRFMVTSIPTLIHYGTSKRLDAHNLVNLDVVKMLFEDAKAAKSSMSVN